MYSVLGIAEPNCGVGWHQRGFQVYHCARNLRGFSKSRGGFSILMRLSAWCIGQTEQLQDNVPPETVSVLCKVGALFGCSGEVLLAGAYISNDPRVCAAYERQLGHSQLTAVGDYIYKHRCLENREVIFIGDFNAYTGTEQGWDGSDACFGVSDDFELGRRRSRCSAAANLRGRELLHLARLNELRIVNGLETSWLNADPSITRPLNGCDVAPGELDGTVLDYVLASDTILHAITDMQVGEGVHISDHRPVRFSWTGSNNLTHEPASRATARRELGPLGWHFKGHPTTEQKRRATEVIAADGRLPLVSQMLKATSNAQGLPELALVRSCSISPVGLDTYEGSEDHPAGEAFRLISAIVRDAWEAVGIDVSVADGEARTDARELDVPKGWYDEEVRCAQKRWHALRRQKHKTEAQRKLCQVARRVYERLRAERKRRERADWERYWCDLAHCDHTNVWRVVNTLAGRAAALNCQVSTVLQRKHYEDLGRELECPDFDWERARAAELWMLDFIAAGRGRASCGPGFMVKEVASAFARLRQCSPGLDGVSKMFMKPILEQLLPAVTALFSYVYTKGIAMPAWSIAVIISIKKKDPSVTDMNNFRGIHLLSFFRQWYAMCLMPGLEALVEQKVPIEQQGFAKGRRIYGSFLALYAMIEQSRVKGHRLYVAFVDVRKAFPSVRRDLLFQKLSELGASDQLTRAVIELYSDACATVRGPEGFSSIFNIHVGTREGGVESPLLYVLFVADLIAELNAEQLTDSTLELDGRPIRALQLADDLALMAESEDDLNRLLSRWESYCDKNHKCTQTKKTEVVIFTHGSDVDLKLEDGVFRFGEGSPLEFLYKGKQLGVAAFFIYLGVCMHWRDGAEAALEHRELKARKALGALQNSLRAVPFLPFARLEAMAEAIVGGVYLYGSELWAPFLDRRAARLDRRYLDWLLGLHGAREDRLSGWLPVRDLDVKAEASVLRTLGDAHRHGGLLLAAVKQLWRTREAARGVAKRATWWGRMLTMVRRTWPGFDVAVRDSITVTAAPRLRSLDTLHVDFYADTMAKRWRARKDSVARAQPSVHQQDYLLNVLVSNGVATEMVFPLRPRADAGAVRALVRTFAGIEDYARWNAHHPRRQQMPGLGAQFARHCCLSCLADSGRFVLDSEWHAICDCPLHGAARRRFAYATDYDFAQSTSDTAQSLIPLVTHVRDNAQFLGELAKFVLNLRATRRHRFRQLKSNGRMGHMRVNLRLIWERWRRSLASYRPDVPQT